MDGPSAHQAKGLQGEQGQLRALYQEECRAAQHEVAPLLGEPSQPGCCLFRVPFPSPILPGSGSMMEHPNKEADCAVCSLLTSGLLLPLLLWGSLWLLPPGTTWPAVLGPSSRGPDSDGEPGLAWQGGEGSKMITSQQCCLTWPGVHGRTVLAGFYLSTCKSLPAEPSVGALH